MVVQVAIPSAPPKVGCVYSMVAVSILPHPKKTIGKTLPTLYILEIHFIKAQINQSRKSSKKLEEIVFSKKPDSNSSETESEKLKLELFRAEKEIERLKNLEIELKDARAEIDRFRSSFENAKKSNASQKI